MTVVMPAGVAVARDLVGPATEAAINRLTPRVRRVAAYHYGLADAAGNQVRTGSGKALRPALADSHRKDVRELARALDQKIGQPIRSLVGNAEQLLISPDGALNLIPFEALADEQGRYLVERYSIGYLTTGRDLLRQQVTRTSKTGPVILADPLFGEPPTSPGARSPARRRSISPIMLIWICASLELVFRS